MEKIDKAKILAELGGIDEGIYDSLVAEHLNQTKERCQEIKRMLDAENIEAVGELAHSIKGSSGNLRLTPLYDAALVLERAAKEKEKSTQLQALARTLEEKTSEALELL
jgi:HPt (histidine-containing phosphotransfer) domain-containing protein